MSSNLDRFKSGANSFGTRYVDGLFKPSITYRANAKYNQDTTNQIVELMNSRPREYVEPNSGSRSFLDRGFDALLTPNYVIAGAIDAGMRGEDPLAGAGKGFLAGNPFGKGYEQGEKSFSDVIRTGIELSGGSAPTSTGGKIGVGTAGFVLDVLLDPTTYMTFGISAALKGTGRVGKAAQTIESLAKNNPDFAKGIQEAGGMTDELAEQIVMRANDITSFDEIAESSAILAERGDGAVGKKIGKEQFVQEVAELKKTYNELIGVGRTGQGISFGIQNMPFGDTVARKLGITSAPTTLVKDSSIRAFSDTVGLSASYQASRNAFYGSKIGQALSRNAGLKKLAEADPTKVYEYIGTLNKLRGKDLDKLAREKHIKEYGETLLGLTPAEQKKVMKALENPALWKATEEVMRGRGTEAWSKIEGEYKNTNEELKSSIAQSKDILDEYKNASKTELNDFKTQLSELKRLENLKPQQLRTLNELDNEISNLIKSKEQVEARLTPNTKDYTSVLKSLDEELDNLVAMREQKYASASTGNAFKDMSTDELSNILNPKLARISELNNMKAVDGKEGTNIALNRQAEITDLRRTVSDILYSNPDVIPPSMSAGRVISIANAIKAGDDGKAFMEALSGKGGGHNFTSNFKNAREVNDYYENNPDIFDVLKNIVKSGSLMSDEMKSVYSYVATKYGYKNITTVRNRNKEIEQVLNLKYNGKLSRPLANEAEEAMFKEYNDNLEMFSNRARDLAEIAKVGNAKAQAKYVKKIEEEALADEMHELLYGETDRARITKDSIADLSDTNEAPEYAGTKYDREFDVEDMRFADEAMKWGEPITAKQAEINHMKASKNDKPYTYDEISAHSRESIKTQILANRRKSLLNYRLSPQAKTVLKEMNTKATELNKLKAGFNSATDKKAFKKDYEKAMSEYKAIRDKAEKTTNLFKVSKELDNLQPQDIKELSSQLEASVYLQSKVFQFHKYDDLTTGQKSLITGLSYAITRKYIKENGIPTKKDVEKFHKFIEKEGADQINKHTQNISNLRAETGHAMNVATKVDYYSGVEFKVGNEVKRGVVVGIKEDVVKKTRQEVDVKFESHHQDDAMEWITTPRLDKKTGEPIINAKTGKPVMKRIMKPVVPRQTRTQTVKNIEYEEGIGSYTYQIETPEGIVSIKQVDVVGTYNNVVEELGHKIPKYVEDEIARIDDEIIALKNKIRGTKSAETRQGKKLSDLERTKQIKLEVLDKQHAELVARKTEEEFFLDNYTKLIDEQKQYMSKVFGDGEGAFPTTPQDIAQRNADEIANIEKEMNSMISRQEQIEKALQDNELFEDLIKLDNGDDAYAKLLEASAESTTSKKLVIDTIQDYPEHIRLTAKAIRKDFQDAGLDEVAIGKLDKGAFDTMADRYFPRTLSDDGIKYFDDNPEFAEKYLSPTRGYGFGKVFNEHVLKRNEELRHKSLDEVNDYFESTVGVRIFEENLGKAYLNRMLTSTDMVYDARAMQDMMHRFGHPVDLEKGLKEGYDVVLNYGELKAKLRGMVSSLIKEEMSGNPVKLTKEEYDLKARQYAEQFLTDAKLDTRILDGETVPLTKLAGEQIEAVQRVFGKDFPRQVNAITVDRANQVRELVMRRDEHKMLQLYDKFMTFFKLNQTTVMPAFHVRNHLGAMFVGWLGVGREALSIKAQKEAFQALKLYGNDMELRNLSRIVTDDRSKVYTYDEVMNLAQTYSVIDEGFMMKDFSAHGYSDGTRLIPGKYDPFNTKEFGLYKIGSKVATYSDNINRITQFVALLKQGKTPAEAGDTVRKYMFDYSDLTSFEMNWMKRIFPYYTYMRKNLPLMANEFLDNPEKLQLLAKISSAPENAVNPEDRIAENEKLGFAQDWIQMPFDLNGANGDEPVLFNPNLPHMQLRDIDMEGNIGEQARTLFSQSAPMLKVPVELATNWNSFFDDEIVREDGDKISPRVVHVLSQLSAFNAGKQFLTAKSGDDAVLSLLNTGTGVKMTTYDVEGARKKIEEETYNKEFELSVRNILGSGVYVANGLIDNSPAVMSDYAIKLAGKPYNANDEIGVYAPISDRTYDEMSDAQKQLYSFDEKTKSFVHNRALEFEREQYEKTGIFKKFMWTIVESNRPEETVVRVDKVVDGDTFTASQGGKNFNVRLLLVDTPESKGDYKDMPQQYSEEASRYTSDLILGKDVKLYLDKKTTYGRKLAFVEIGGQSVQEGLIQEGLGKVRQYDTNYTDVGNELYNLEEEAYLDGKGVWSQPGNASPRSNTGFVR